VPTIYKYASDSTALINLSFSASDPASFNDPFEIRPFFDQARHDHFAKSHEGYYAKIGFPHSLVEGGSMVGVPTEHALGFAEELNEHFRRELSKTFRVVCFSKSANSALMWGHYAKSHNGLVIGIDATSGNIATGLRPEGFEIKYVSSREKIKLPLSYYSMPSVETYDFRGDIANNPNELVESDGGIMIPFSEYRRQVEEAMLLSITNKSSDWAYEKEVRYGYRLADHAKQLQLINGRHFVSIPPEAVREIIFGFQTDADVVLSVLELHAQGKLGNPRFFQSGCHPFLYEIQTHEAKPDYLKQLYTVIKQSR
jgi:hypothetical protein